MKDPSRETMSIGIIEIIDIIEAEVCDANNGTWYTVREHPMHLASSPS